MKVFRGAFDQFDCRKGAAYDEAKIVERMNNDKIIRNRFKIQSAVTNVRQFIKIQEEYGSFDAFIRSYVGNNLVVNHFDTEAAIPAKTPLSDRISQNLKNADFDLQAVRSYMPICRRRA